MTELTADQQVDLCLGDVMQDVAQDNVSAAEVRPDLCLQARVITPSTKTAPMSRLLPLGQSQTPAPVRLQSTKDSTANKQWISLPHPVQTGLFSPSSHPSRQHTRQKDLCLRRQSPPHPCNRCFLNKNKTIASEPQLKSIQRHQSMQLQQRLTALLVLQTRQQPTCPKR